MSAVEEFERAWGLVERVSLLAQLRDYVAEAVESTRPKCGTCQHWMKSRICPKEHNVNGYSRGPSCNAVPCDQYKLDAAHSGIARKKCQQAIDFAERHDLPIPGHLKA